VSLNGNLEDLPLLDIIQIVSFSKKTGYLTIRRERGEAAIVFEDGNVVAAFTPESPPPGRDQPPCEDVDLPWENNIRVVEAGEITEGLIE